MTVDLLEYSHDDLTEETGWLPNHTFFQTFTTKGGEGRVLKVLTNYASLTWCAHLHATMAVAEMLMNLKFCSHSSFLQ